MFVCCCCWATLENNKGRKGVFGDYDDDGLDEVSRKLALAMPVPCLAQILIILLCFLFWYDTVKIQELKTAL